MDRLEMARRLKAAAGRVPAGSRPWYRITAEAGDSGPVRVDVYDEIGGSWFSDGVSAASFTQQLAAVPPGRELHVHINSPGGDVFDGLAIYNAIAQRPGPVTTVVDGLAASAASFVAQAGKTRLLCPGSMMMVHDASGFCIGSAAEMRELADLLELVSGNIADIYAAHTGRPAAWWQDAMRAETWYKAAQAVDAGLADKLAERPAPAGATARFDLSVFARVPEWVRAAPRAAAAPHGPMTGSHTHPHPAYGSQGSDSTHDHAHWHDGDASHDHGHDRAGDSPDGRSRREPAQAAATGQCCPQCGPDCACASGQASAAASSQVLGTESMPLRNEAIPVHHTATVDEPWDGPAAVAAMPADAKVLRYCHAWQDTASDDGTGDDPDGDADDRKSSYKFPHHKTSGGPANLAACRNGLARLPGADIPDGDRAGVRAHLQAHLDDGKDDDGAGDRAAPDVSGAQCLEQIRAALKGANP